MRNILLTVFLLPSLLYLASCKKDSSDTKVDLNIKGTYHFLSLTGSTRYTQTRVEPSTVIKTVQTAKFTSKNNDGTVTINDSTMISSSLTYLIDTIITYEVYENDVLKNTYTDRFMLPVPPSFTTSDYKWIASDSVYFPNLSFFWDGITTSDAPAAARIKLEGDKLYIFQYKEQNWSSELAQSTTTVILQKQ